MPSTKVTSTPINYKPLKVHKAIGFGLEYHENYKLLYIFKHYEKQKDTTTYLLLPHGASIPAKFKYTRTIRTPVKKFVTMSSTHIGLLDALQSVNAIVGHANGESIYNPLFLKKLKEGQIAELGRDEHLNTELTLALQPGVVIAVGSPGQSYNAYAILEEAGIPVIFNSDWQETSLLARAEWIKLIGALMDKETLADQKYSHMQLVYDSLTQLTKNVGARPMVIANSPIKGIWYLPGGHSYVARLIEDAGGYYPWKKNTATGSFIVPFEQAFETGSKADFWINVRMSGPNGSLEDLDQRLVHFPAYMKNNIYNFTKKVGVNGANDYWESGIANPHVILKDLIKICHPELLPSYSLHYYERVSK